MWMPLPRSLKLSMACSRLRARRERDVGWYEEIAEGFAIAAPDAASQLMKFAEAEILGVVYYYCVYVGHVNAALDDCSGNEHVIVMIGEIDDCLLKFFRGHLSVSHYCACIRNEALHLCFKFVEPFDTVVYHEDLTVARQFEVDGFGYYVVAAGADRGYDGIAVGRRSVERCEVACAH